MNIIKREVVKDNTSCNFCSRGTLSVNGRGLDYPYTHVYEIQRGAGGGLQACICGHCLDKLVKVSNFLPGDSFDDNEAKEVNC